MRKYIIVVLLFFVSVTSLNASTYSGQLPKGKNYLDPNNFEYENNSLHSITEVRVKPSTTYTLTLPGTTTVDDLFIFGYTDLLVGNPSSIEECTLEYNKTVCTFTTIADDDRIEIYIGGEGLGQYYTYNGMALIQLEEGSVSTDYEGYNPPIEAPETFSGEGAYLLSYTNELTIESIVGTHFTATDEIDGNVTNNITIRSDDYTENKSLIGEYDVVVEARDSLNNFTTYNLTVIVKDDVNPEIQGDETYITDVSNPVDIDTIIASYHGEDEYDGVVEVVLEEDNYTSNIDQVGTYYITLSATDNSLNKEVRTIPVKIKDFIAPEIIGDLDITTNLSNIKDIDSIVYSLKIKDNYYDDDQITVEVLNDNYTSNMNNIGTYTVDIKLTDPEQNSSTTTISITVVDDVDPIVVGPNAITVSYEDLFRETDFRDLFTVTDNSSSLSSLDIQILTNTYSGNESTIGAYKITFKVEDDSGNSVIRTLNITVIDDIPPVLFVDDFVVTVPVNAKLTELDIVKLLVNDSELDIDDYDVNVILDEYTVYKKTPGYYNYQVKLTDSFGNITHKSFMIKVVDTTLVSTTNEFPLLTRNIVTYSSVLALISFVIFKKLHK